MGQQGPKQNGFDLQVDYHLRPLWCPLIGSHPLVTTIAKLAASQVQQSAALRGQLLYWSRGDHPLLQIHRSSAIQPSFLACFWIVAAKPQSSSCFTHSTFNLPTLYPGHSRIHSLSFDSYLPDGLDLNSTKIYQRFRALLWSTQQSSAQTSLPLPGRYISICNL